MKTALHRINLNEIGGVERLFDNFLAASPDSEHHVVLNQPVHPFLNQVDSAHLHNIKWRGGKKLWRPFRRAHAKRIFSRIDPRVMLYWDTEERNLNLLKSRSKDSPLFFYDHGYSWLTNKEKRFSEFLRHVDICIACSEASRRMLELRWEVSAPIHVIKNPLRPDILLKPAKPKKAPQNRALRMGCVGRLVPAKGHCVAIHVLAGLKKEGVDAELHIAGSGKYLLELKRLAQKLGVSDAVYFLGCIDDIAAFYDSIDICINPSISEAFGLISVEAQAFGCVPIVSYTDGLAETIVRGKTGIGIIPSLEHDQFPSLGGSMKGFPRYVYDPIEDRLHRPNVMDPSRAVQEITSLLGDPKRYEAMSQAGIAHASSSFQFDDYVERVERLVLQRPTEKPAMQIAHLLTANSSNLYLDYLKSAAKKPQRDNTVVLEGRLKGEACTFAKRSALGLWQSRYLGSLALPLPLVQKRTSHALKVIAPDLSVHWNCSLGPLNAPKNLYYDFDHSWGVENEGNFAHFLSQVDGVCVGSYASRRMLESRFECSGPIQQLPLAFRKACSSVLPKKLLSYRPFVFGVNVAGAELALHVLSHLVKEGSDVRLLIIGDASHLHEQIEELSLSEKVLILGKTHDVEGFFLSIDVLYAGPLQAPSAFEAARAFSYGCPVIAPALDAYPEVVSAERGYCLALDEFEIGLTSHVPKYIYDPALDKITSAKTAHPQRVAKAIASYMEGDLLMHQSRAALAWSNQHLNFEHYMKALRSAFETCTS